MLSLSYILVVIDMFISATLHKAGIIIKALAIFTLCMLIIIYSDGCSNGALKGIEMCLKVLVPSLFPFMAVSSFIVKSGLAFQLGKPFGKLTRLIFGLSGSFAPIILLSLIGGYPVGAKGISALVDISAVSKSEAKKALMFCVCAGPGFIVSFVGASIYQNKTVGLIILASQIISVFVLGILINIFCKDNYSDKELCYKSVPFSNALVEATLDSTKGIVSICAFVILFSAFAGIIESIFNSEIKSYIFCLLEVCNAVTTLTQLELVAFAIGFGGLCVHFQIFSAVKNIEFNKVIFFLIRIIQGFITALLTHLGADLFLKEQAVFSTSTVESADFFGGTVISGMVLIGISICFLFTFKNYKHN